MKPFANDCSVLSLAKVWGSPAGDDSTGTHSSLQCLYHLEFVHSTDKHCGLKYSLRCLEE